MDRGLRDRRSRLDLARVVWPLIGALGLVACGGGIPVYLQSDPNPTPYVGSIFTQCTVFVMDSGKPGRSLDQHELEISPAKIGACPENIVLSNASNSPGTGTNGHAVFHVSSTPAPGVCSYAGPTADNFASCKLAPSTGSAPGAPAQSSSAAPPPPAPTGG
jgi:hypothetical protein